MSFNEFFKWKYQVNIDGTVAAYRLGSMLAGNSLVCMPFGYYGARGLFIFLMRVIAIVCGWLGLCAVGGLEPGLYCSIQAGAIVSARTLMPWHVHLGFIILTLSRHTCRPWCKILTTMSISITRLSRTSTMCR